MAPSTAEPPRATYTAQQLRRGLLETADRIKSLHVVYQSDDYDPNIYSKGTYLHRRSSRNRPAHCITSPPMATRGWPGRTTRTSSRLT